MGDELAVQSLFEGAMAGETPLFDRNPRLSDPKILLKGDFQGETACHVALKHGHPEYALRICSIHPPCLYTRNKLGDTALHYAVQYEQPEFLLEGLQRLRAHLDSHLPEIYVCGRSFGFKEGKSLLYQASEKGYAQAVEFMLDTPILYENKSPDGSTALHAAVRKRRYDVIKVFLKSKPWEADAEDAIGHTPLHLAVVLNELQIVDLLVNGRKTTANILSKDGSSPIHLAASMNRLQILRLLLQVCPEYHMTTTARGQNLLHIAVEEKVADIAEFVGKDEKVSEFMINQKDDDCNTPLHIAFANGDEKMEKVLLASRPNVLPIKNKDGFTYRELAMTRRERQLAEKRAKMQTDLLHAMKDLHSSLLVMTTLITTVTFTAAFTLPGGYKSDGPDQGMATLLKRAGFKVFLMSDTISMCSSIAASAALILFPVFHERQTKFCTLKVAMGSIAISVTFMLVAFAAGVWVVIGSKCKWLASLIAIVTGCTSVGLTLVLGHIKLTSGNEDEEFNIYHGNFCLGKVGLDVC